MKLSVSVFLVLRHVAIAFVYIAYMTYFLITGSKKAMRQFQMALGINSKNETARHTRELQQACKNLKIS